MSAFGELQKEHEQAMARGRLSAVGTPIVDSRGRIVSSVGTSPAEECREEAPSPRWPRIALATLAGLAAITGVAYLFERNNNNVASAAGPELSPPQLLPGDTCVNGNIYHTIKPFETLSFLARTYGTSISEMATANKLLANPDLIISGKGLDTTRSCPAGMPDTVRPPQAPVATRVTVEATAAMQQAQTMAAQVNSGAAEAAGRVWNPNTRRYDTFPLARVWEIRRQADGKLVAVVETPPTSNQRHPPFLLALEDIKIQPSGKAPGCRAEVPRTNQPDGSTLINIPRLDGNPWHNSLLTICKGEALQRNEKAGYFESNQGRTFGTKVDVISPQNKVIGEGFCITVYGHGNLADTSGAVETSCQAIIKKHKP